MIGGSIGRRDTRETPHWHDWGRMARAVGADYRHANRVGVYVPSGEGPGVPELAVGVGAYAVIIESRSRGRGHLDVGSGQRL